MADIKNEHVGCTSVSASAQRLEAVNLGYESVGGPRRTFTDNDYAISSIPAWGKINNHAAITAKNDPAIADNPAYSTSSGPALVDNPAYIAAMRGGPGTTTVLSHDIQ